VSPESESSDSHNNYLFLLDNSAATGAIYGAGAKKQTNTSKREP
jgi:hypothetical protein